MRLTEKEYWENYWREYRLPVEIKKGTGFLVDEILNVFDKYLPKKELHIIEIGGAPGQYLAYIQKQYNYNICSIDYTEIGCKKTEQNFNLLGISGTTYKRDLFSDISDLPKFDVVYSLGFIEHFSNLDDVIEKHLELLKPDGILIIGAPNFLGLNKKIFEKINPDKLAKHELAVMDLENWKSFEKTFKLETLFKGYIGGLEPRIYDYKNKTLSNLFIYFIFRMVQTVTDRIRILRKFNSKYFSGYVMGVYKKP